MMLKLWRFCSLILAAGRGIRTFSVTYAGVCGYLQIWSLLLAICFIRDRWGKAEMHSSDLQAEDRTVSVCHLKYPGLFGLQ